MVKSIPNLGTEKQGCELLDKFCFYKFLYITAVKESKMESLWQKTVVTLVIPDPNKGENNMKKTEKKEYIIFYFSYFKHAWNRKGW